MNAKEFEAHYQEHLRLLVSELEAYPNESTLWEELPGTLNSAGVLAHHVYGNLNHFIGMVLGHSSYKRNRPAEFEERNIPRAKLISELQECGKMLKSVLPQLTSEQLVAPYPKGYFGNLEGSVASMLAKLLTHLAYHRGQINYHRRYFASKL